MRPLNTPDGYYYLEMFIVGSNVSKVMVLVCKKCGLVTGDSYQHNKWHENVREYGVVRFENVPEKGENLPPTTQYKYRT